MTLKLVKKGLTESKEKCPNCQRIIEVWKDEKGKIQKAYPADILRDNTIRCECCDSVLQVE